MISEALPQAFYNRSTLAVARDLLGKRLIRFDDNDTVLSGIIVETEAYIGQDDPACHAARGRTQRTELMFGPPGYAYIYFIYGMYYCLNAVTEATDFPAAVLIRAVEPESGIEAMKERRKRDKLKELTNGPGKLCQAFGLDKSQNGFNLSEKPLIIANAPAIPEANIAASPRVGISVAKERPWRFYVKDNRFVSKAVFK